VAELDFRERAMVSSFAVDKADHAFRVAGNNARPKSAVIHRLGVG
jgi:hypothetical protein